MRSHSQDNAAPLFLNLPLRNRCGLLFLNLPLTGADYWSQGAHGRHSCAMKWMAADLLLIRNRVNTTVQAAAKAGKLVPCCLAATF